MRIAKLVDVADEADSFRLDDMSRFNDWLKSTRLDGSFRNELDERIPTPLVVELVNESSEEVDELIVLSDWSTICVATLLTVSTRLVGCTARLVGVLNDDDAFEPLTGELVASGMLEDGRRNILKVERRRESGFVENLFKFECSFQICEFLLEISRLEIQQQC